MNRFLFSTVVLIGLAVNFSSEATQCNCNHQSISSSIEAYEPYDVGELGELWQFPSDHLPIGVSISDFHMVFWNILNKDYLFHIESNTQGLKNSAILTDDVRITEDETLTVREGIVGEMVLEMITHPTHPRSLIALQETHVDVLAFITAKLPPSWDLLTPPDQPNSQDLFLYNTDIFEFIDLDAVKYTPDRNKTIFTITLREKSSGKLFRFVQSHVPGGPDSPVSCAKFSKEALRQYDPNITTVLMGDMNKPPSVIQQALDQSAEELDVLQPYCHLPVEYPSHMNTKLQASWIDNFFISTPRNNPEQIQASHQAEELSNVLVPIVELLKNFSNQDVK